MRVTVHRDPGLGAAALAVVRRASLATLLRAAGDELHVPSRAGLALRLTGDAELRVLNRDHLATDAPTDVLAFPGGEPLWVGDVAISVERAVAQAPGDPAHELRLLAVHGLLHCLGHDHADPRGAAEMTRVTRALLPAQEIPALEAH